MSLLFPRELPEDVVFAVILHKRFTLFNSPFVLQLTNLIHLLLLNIWLSNRRLHNHSAFSYASRLFNYLKGCSPNASGQFRSGVIQTPKHRVQTSELRDLFWITKPNRTKCSLVNDHIIKKSVCYLLGLKFLLTSNACGHIYMLINVRLVEFYGFF